MRKYIYIIGVGLYEASSSAREEGFFDNVKRIRTKYKFIV